MERIAELDSITKDRDAKRKLLEDLKRKRLDNFMEGFGIITSKLKEMYQMITLGGDAELELVSFLSCLNEHVKLLHRSIKCADLRSFLGVSSENMLALILAFLCLVSFFARSKVLMDLNWSIDCSVWLRELILGHSWF